MTPIGSFASHSAELGLPTIRCMDRKHYDDDHLAFADAFRAFADKVVVPNYLDWERAGITPREVFQEAGKRRLPGHGRARAVRRRRGRRLPVQPGAGRADRARRHRRHRASACRCTTTSACRTSSPTAPTSRSSAGCPGIASGELITAVAMTEPGAGSDLAGIRTTAKRDGDHYVVNGAKTFITNGINADLVITAVKTGTDRATGAAACPCSILERGMAGFERGRNLDKLGLHSQDTAELSFSDVRVPVENLLGEEGEGFALPHREAAAGADVHRDQPAWPRPRAALRRRPLQYVQDRKAFGTSDRRRSRTPSSCWPRSPPRSTSRRPSSTAASTG